MTTQLKGDNAPTLYRRRGHDVSVGDNGLTAGRFDPVIAVTEGPVGRRAHDVRRAAEGHDASSLNCDPLRAGPISDADSAIGVITTSNMPTTKNTKPDARRNPALPETTPGKPKTFALTSLDFPEGSMLRVEQVSATLRISPQHITNLILEGELYAADMRGPGALRAMYRIPVEAYRDYILRSLTADADRGRLMRDLPRATLVQLQADLAAVLASRPAETPAA